MSTVTITARPAAGRGPAGAPRTAFVLAGTSAGAVRVGRAEDVAADQDKSQSRGCAGRQRDGPRAAGRGRQALGGPGPEPADHVGGPVQAQV